MEAQQMAEARDRRDRPAPGRLDATAEWPAHLAVKLPP